MTEYSSDKEIDKFVAKLVREMRNNPYDPQGRSATVAGVVEMACHAYGRKRARTIRITLH